MRTRTAKLARREGLRRCAARHDAGSFGSVTANCSLKPTNTGTPRLATANSPAPVALPDAAEEAVRQVLYAADAPPNLPPSQFDPLYDVASIQMIRKFIWQWLWRARTET